MKLTTFLVLACSLLVAGHAAAKSGDNHAPICTNPTLEVSGLPEEMPLSNYEFDPILLGGCTDPDGDTVVLQSADAPASVDDGKIKLNSTLEVGSSVTVTYTVSDGNGASTTSTVTVSRN